MLRESITDWLCLLTLESDVWFKHQCYLDIEQTMEHLAQMPVHFADCDPCS